jgi:fatty-acyl-CoA synthase
MTPLDYSYVHGTSDQPLVGETIGVHFARAAQRHGDREAVVMRHQNVRLSYRELLQRVDDFAAGLIALGLQPGDRIGIWSTNCIEWVITQFATSRAGLIQVNLDPAYRAAEIEYALNKVGCKALITMDRFKSSDYLGILRTLMPEIATTPAGELQAAKVPALRTLIRIGEGHEDGFVPFHDVPAGASADHHEALQALQHRLQSDDAINIQFTSGTTGAPKATTLSHHTLLNNALALGRILGVREHDRLCRTGPLFHIMGTTASLYTLSMGATLVFPSPTFDARAALQAVHDERCTHLSGVPTMFVMMLNLPEFASYDLSCLRGGIMGGSPCPAELMQRVMTDMHMAGLIITYGMTETGPTSMCTRPADTFDRRVNTVGQAFPHTEVKIVDTDGRTVPVGVPGELCVRGFTVMIGYWGDADSTARAIDAGGWMHTGDLATMDADGYGRIVGRIKEMVIRGGENIFPREIEAFLLSHPDVADAQVFGVPDAKFGEELCAWVMARPGQTVTEDALRAHCRERIAHYKVPRHIRIVDGYPVNATGKAQKLAMRAQMIKELNP